MSNSQYDNDATIWSPQGRLLQVEYACEAIKQGAVSLGIRNKSHLVLLALKVKINFAFYLNSIVLEITGRFGWLSEKDLASG